MSHTHHIASHKELFEQRSAFIRSVREFFWSQNFLEVETPILLRLPGQEPYLSPMKIDIHNESGDTFRGYLHTSPEYTMKKFLAAGFPKIFSLCKVFRDYESFGGTHNPEFTMIEWYRANSDFYAIMDDVEGLTKMQFRRIHMKELWQEFVRVNLDEYLEREAMVDLCKQKDYDVQDTESYEDAFFRIFLNEIEPRLAELGPVIVHHYPAPMAALSRLSPIDPRYAERFEVYMDGIEIANCFSELTDAAEQEKRLQAEQKERARLGKDVFDVDAEFIDAVRHMPPASGIALGIDRLFMALTGCKKIEDVIALPANLLF